MLGSAATEQLWMQRLEGDVELELKMTPFSQAAEIRGTLSPVHTKPHVQTGAVNHRGFTLLEAPSGSSGLSEHTRARQREMAKDQLPPVMMQRTIKVLAPLPNLWSLLQGGSSGDGLSIFCRKSRKQTEYFNTPPKGFSTQGWGLA